MTDPTTEGYTASAAEIDGMVRNLCAYALSEPDPLQRYADLTHQQVVFDGIVAALQRERGRALADLIVAGTPIAEVGAKTNLATAARVRKLISAAGETERVKEATARRPAGKSRSAKPKAVETPPAPASLVVTGKRVLTAAERVALGLPPSPTATVPTTSVGPTPPAQPRRRRQRASA